MKIYSNPDTQKVLCEAGHHLAEALRKTKTPMLLLLSGGSSLDLLHHVDASVIDTRVTIGLVDERFTTDVSKTNFQSLVRHPFFIPALRNGANIIDPSTGYKETIKDEADRLDKAYKKWLIEHKNGSIICTVGIGEDGHTAGIFPMPGNKSGFRNLFLDTDRCVIGYGTPHGVEIPDRVTSTFSLLQKASCIILYAVGEKKRPALETVCIPRGRIEETPARIYREFNEDAVCLFTDQTGVRYAL